MLRQSPVYVRAAEWTNERLIPNTFLHGSFKLWWICCVPSGCYRKPGKTFLLDFGNWECALCFLDRTSFWPFHVSRGRMDPLACNWYIVASFNKEPILPEETVFPLTRYNLGSSAMRGAVLGNLLQRLSYLTRIQTALLHNSPCWGPMKGMSWDRYSKILGQILLPSSCCTTQKWTWFQQDDPILSMLFYPLSPITLPNHCLIQDVQRNKMGKKINWPVKSKMAFN